MNIAGPVLNRLHEDQIDEADNRRLVGEPGHHIDVVGRLDLADLLGDLFIGA